MGMTGFMYYKLSVVPMQVKLEEQASLIIAQELRDAEQKAAIAAVTQHLEITTQSMSVMSKQNQQYESQMNEYLDIFRRHNIAQLASAKPGLIEAKINKATKEVFDGIENDSIRISNLND
jgi:hypothetical protein